MERSESFPIRNLFCAWHPACKASFEYIHGAGKQADVYFMGSGEHGVEWSARVVRDNTRLLWGHKSHLRGTRLFLKSPNLSIEHCLQGYFTSSWRVEGLGFNSNHPRYAMVLAQYGQYWLCPSSTEQRHNPRCKANLLIFFSKTHSRCIINRKLIARSGGTRIRRDSPGVQERKRERGNAYRGISGFHSELHLNIYDSG